MMTLVQNTSFYKRILILVFICSASFAQKPELVVQAGHSGPIDGVTFSPDGRILVSGSWDNAIKLWDVGTGKELRTLGGHAGGVLSVTFSPGGKTLASSHENGTIKLWDAGTGKELRTLRGHCSGVPSVTFSPDGRTLASGSRDSTVKLWDVGTGKQLRTLVGHAYGINSVAFSPDGRTLASGGEDTTIKLWDVATGKELRTLRGHTGPINSVTFYPVGRILASGSEDTTIRFWDADMGKELGTLRGHTDAIESVIFSPDGRMLASGGMDNTVKLWDLGTLEELQTLVGHALAVLSLSFSTDGKTLASASYDKTIKLWDVGTGQELRTLGGRTALVRSVAFSPDGKTLVSGGGDNAIKLWDVATGKELKMLEGHTNCVSSVAFGPDRKTIASGSDDNTVRLWDIGAGKELRRLRGHTNWVLSVAFSPDGKTLASGGGDNAIKLWDVATGKDLEILKGHSDEVNSVTFSPDGKTLASGSWDEIQLWDVRKGKELLSLVGDARPVLSVAFSPDGKTLASGCYDKTIKLWDVGTGKELRTLRGHTNTVYSVTFSPDGKILASGSSDKTIKLWDVGAGKELRTLRGHTNVVFSVAFSPDGKTLASGSADATIKLWDVAKGKELVSMIAVDVANNTLSNQVHNSPSGVSQLSQKDFVVVTNDFYYSASKGGLRALAFRIANRALPVEQFDAQFNRPDIVLERLGRAPKDLIEAYHHAYEKRLKRLGLDETMFNGDFHLPEVSVLTKKLPLVTEERSLKFEVSATDSKYLLTRLYITVNDVPIHGYRGIDLRTRRVSSCVHEDSVELSRGRNKIQISVLNEKGVESLKETFEVIFNGPSLRPDLYVVAIGVSRYTDTLYDLQYADKDAEALADFFKSDTNHLSMVKTQKSFKVDNLGKVRVETFLNGNATLENIRNAKKIFLMTKPNDHVILFFAGHGILDDSLNYYLATTDMDFKRPSERGLPYEALEDLFDGIPARNRLILVDACHSGEIDKEDLGLWTPVRTGAGTVHARSVGKKRGVELDQKPRLGLQNSFDLMNDLFADLRRNSGAMVISAAGGLEYALEAGRWGHGVFTYSLLEALNANKKTVSSIRDYVLDRVQELTNGNQKPTVRRENLEFDFEIW